VELTVTKSSNTLRQTPVNATNRAVSNRSGNGGGSGQASSSTLASNNSGLLNLGATDSTVNASSDRADTSFENIMGSSRNIQFY
jgi:hypothetical protein